MSIFVVGALILLSCGLITSAGDANDIPLDEYRNYMLLVSDAQEHYQASSVFLIYAGNDESIHMSTLMMQLSRHFSTKYVLSLTINYTDLSHRYSYYRGLIKRPLFVVLLSSVVESRLFERVSREFEMSFPFWLVIFTHPTSSRICSRPRRNYFNLAFDTEMMVKCFGEPIIREWYSLKKDTTIVSELARWDPVRRLRLKTGKSLYERRHTLAGKNLLVATVKESPFITQGPMSGLFAMIVHELSYALNFTMTTAHKEEAYGMYDEETKRWTGVIGRLSRHEVDLGVAEMTMTRQRLDTVDFTLPIMLSRNHLYMKEPESELQWTGYFKVYTFDVWIALEAMYVLTCLIITYMRMTIKEKPIPPNHISENYLCVWGIYCQQGLTEFPKASPLRIAYFSILVTAVVLLAIYSACLISYLTVSTPTPPFRDLAEFAADGSYRLIAFQQSADYDLFATSTDSVLKKMMNQMIDRKYLPKTMMAGFRQACNDKVAFYATEAVKTQISARIPCDLIFLESGRIDSLGITLTKRSQYTGVINYHLQKFKDVGIMNRLRSYVYKKVSSFDNKYNPVNLGGIATILLLLGAGIILSLIILLVEIIAYRSKANKQNRKIITTCKNRIVVTKNTMICESILST